MEKRNRINRQDLLYMRLAINEASQAAKKGEVPVGAVIVDRAGELLASAANSPISSSDPSSHAEIAALRLACRTQQNYRLPGASLYVTLEPCIMCMGALLHARIDRLVYGAADPKTGAAVSLYQLGGDRRLNHQIEVYGGVLAEECGEILRNFFRERRKAKKTQR